MFQEFASHKLNQNGIDKMQATRTVFNMTLGALVELCPTNREFSIVKTKLEEACFFAIKSICVDAANQGTESGYAAPEVKEAA